MGNDMYADVLDIYRRHLSRGRAKISDVFGTGLEVSAQGAWIETSDGERFLNAGGYGVMIHGARHPHVEAAVIHQIRTNPIASRILLEPQAAFAAEALGRHLPPWPTSTSPVPGRRPPRPRSSSPARSAAVVSSPLTGDTTGRRSAPWR
jgi:hypothetical protein